MDTEGGVLDSDDEGEVGSERRRYSTIDNGDRESERGRYRM
jgi:hypothetical protein